MGKENNKDKIEKSRKETEEKLKEDGAKRVTNRGEKGLYVTGSRLEVTPTQIENAKKEMLEELEPVKAKLEKVSKKIKELEKKYKDSNVKKGIEGSKEELENKINKEVEKLREIEEIKDSPQLEKEKVLKEIEERFGQEEEELEKENNKLKTQLEITKERADKLVEKEEKEKLDKKLNKVAQKIVNNEVINQEELDLQLNHPEKLKEKMKQLWREKEQTKSKETNKSESEDKEKNIEDEEETKESKEGAESEKEKKEGEEEEQEEESKSKKDEEGLPENLEGYLKESTLGVKNKEILADNKWWQRIRRLAAGVGGAIGLKTLLKKVPDLPYSEVIKPVPITGVAGGAIAGVGLKLGEYGLEKWDETKNYKNFKEDLDFELDYDDVVPESLIREKMKDTETNISIMERRIKELKEEKVNLKEEGVWFFQKERRELATEIHKHKKALERHRDQLRYLSVELKKENPDTNVEELVRELIESKKEQLEKLKEVGGPHGELLEKMLVSIENSKQDDEKKNKKEFIENAKTGLKGKLEGEGGGGGNYKKIIVTEILRSSAFCAIIGGVTEYVMENEAIQNQFEEIRDWVSDKVDSLSNGETISELSGLQPLIEKLTTTTDESLLETIDEIAEKEASYSIESGDNIWSVTEEFLNDNLNEEFSSLSEAEQTYVIDHISTTIESNPQSFGLEFAEEETIDHLFTGGRHNIDFSPLLDGELELAFQKAESLSTKEVANILENNEIIREFLRDHKNVKITGETIESIVGSGEVSELTEERIADELIVDGLKSDSISSAEQLQNIESWLEDMHNGELNEAHFDFMADTTEGGKRELWIKQLAKVEGVSYEEMEVMIEDSFADIESKVAETTTEATTEGLTEREEEIVNDWVERIEEKNLSEPQYETLLESENEEMLEEIAKERDSSVRETKQLIQERIEEIKETRGKVKTSPFGEEAEELADEVASESEAVESETVSEKTTEVEGGSVETTYEIEGTVTRNDRWQFFEAFQQEFGEEIFVESDIAELLESGEITPEEFINWVEDGAFEENVDFGGEHPPKNVLTRQLENSIQRMKEAEDQTVYMGRLRALKMQISRLILYGK